MHSVCTSLITSNEILQELSYRWKPFVSNLIRMSMRTQCYLTSIEFKDLIFFFPVASGFACIKMLLLCSVDKPCDPWGKNKFEENRFLPFKVARRREEIVELLMFENLRSLYCDWRNQTGNSK